MTQSNQQCNKHYHVATDIIPQTYFIWKFKKKGAIEIGAIDTNHCRMSPYGGGR